MVGVKALLYTLIEFWGQEFWGQHFTLYS